MAEQVRKDRAIRNGLKAVEPSRRGGETNPPDDHAASGLTPEWIAAMLLDVTSHLMNAVDRASRLREPIERIAAAAEASAEANEIAGKPRFSMAAIGAVLATAVILAIMIPIALHLLHPAQVEVVSARATSHGNDGFLIGGVHYEVSREIFAQRLKAVAPERIHRYWVEIGGRKFPVKQAVAIGLGAERATFSSSQAIRVVRELGFNQGETSE